MTTITVSSNPSTTGDTLTVNFTTDATNITDILISKDGGSTYESATSFTSSKAIFNISSWSNGTYNNCKLKCVYTESGGGTTDTYYNITYTLGESTSTNSITSVKAGSSYSTTVTPKEGYKITEIYCVMGGTDISSSAVSGNNISIPNVTGEIYITIITAELSPTPETLTISNIANITQPEKTEFYIEYSTNITVTKHEVSWDGGNTFYDKTSDVIANGTSYKFKHDNSGNAGTYNMAIRVTTAGGTTKTSNVFTVTLNVNDAGDTYYSAEFTYNHPTNNSFRIAEDNKTHTFTKYDTSYTIPLIVPDGFNGNLTWTSSDTYIAIVEEGGIVSPRTNGNCTIRITDGQNYNDTYEIIVNIQ